MGCNCGNKAKADKVKYEVRTANGEVKSYNTKPEATVAAARYGGSITEVAR